MKKKAKISKKKRKKEIKNAFFFVFHFHFDCLTDSTNFLKWSFWIFGNLILVASPNLTSPKQLLILRHEMYIPPEFELMSSRVK